MKLILRFLKPYRWLLTFVLLVMVLDVAGGLLIPTITADIINHGISGGTLFPISFGEGCSWERFLS